MIPGWFITGTDTGVGKTLVSAALLKACRDAGRPAVGMKPVASGCRPGPRGLRNGDAELLRGYSDGRPAYNDINPYAFAPAVAPHLAAAGAGRAIDLGLIVHRARRLAAGDRLLVVEGVGGWRVPLGADRDMADLARQLGLPVILVVGMRLGCLNHALLTAQAVQDDGLPLTGWVANRLDPGMEDFDGNLRCLAARIPAPLLGVVPTLDRPCPEGVVAHLEMKTILNPA